MATASVTVAGAGASGVIPCPLPATVEDAICAAQKMQPGGWENAVLFHGIQHLKPVTALEAAAYTLVSYDALGSRAINVPQTECRGINLKQLSQLVDFIRDHAHLWVETYSGSPNFEQPLELQTFNLYHASHWVIKPATLQYTCSFVELVAEDAETQFPCWFVSHAWQEAVCRFVACLRQHAELRNAVGLAYWVCAYANNQHKLQEEISANPRGTSFYKAMKLAVGVVLILDRDATPFTRIWCCFEESIAVEERNTGTPLLLDVAATDASNEAHVITDGLAAPEARLMPLLGFLTKALREAKFPTLLAQKGLSVDISKADASQAEDKIRILNCIRLPQAKTKELTDVAPLQDPNYSAVNKALAAHFAIASWFGAVTQGHDTSTLRRALAADSSRQMVELSFTSCLGFGDDSLQQLLNHLPRKLRLLRLDLAFSGVRSWNFQKEMPPLEQLTLRFTGSMLADASSLAQMLDTEQCLARSLKSLQLWLSDLPSLVRLGSWEPLAQLPLEELVLQLQRCGQVLPEAKESLYSCVKQLKRARRGLDLRLKIEGVAEPSWSWSWSGCQPQVQEVELAGSKAVDDVDFDDAIDDFGPGRAPFPCSHSRCNEFHENLHGFCPQHRLLRHWWKLASWWRTAWQWAELSLLFGMQAAAEIQQRTTLAVILLSLYPVACLSLEESLGVPWAVICTLLSVIVLSSIVTTSIRFDTVRTQILQEAVATEASYSQVLQLPTQNVTGLPWLPSHAGNMLRVPTMGCGYADPREIRQQSKDLAGLFLGAHQHLPLLRTAMNVALPDATLKLKLLTSLSDEEKQSPQQVLDVLRFELMRENMQSVQEVFKGLEDRLASEEMVALGVRIAAVRDTFAEMSGASGQKCCQVVLQVEDYYASVILMDVTLTRLENQLSDLTKLADHFGLLDDVKSKWETSLRLCNDSPSGPLTMAGTIFLQIVALVVSFFMAIQYFLRYAPRIRSRLSDFLLDALALDTEESNETFLEAAVLALPYLVLVVVFLLQLLCRKTSRKRPRPTEVLYEKYFGLRGAYYPFKVAIFQCFTVAVQAFGKISLLGGLVTFAQEEQDATAMLWLSVGYWAFFALLCWNSLYPAFLLMFPDTASARIGAAFMDAALDLGYILTYLGMVLVAMLRLRTASEGWGNFGEDLTLQFSNRVSPVFAFPTDFLGYGAVYLNLAHACCIAHILQHTNWSLPVRPRGERQKRRWLPRVFGCFLSIGLLSMLVILLVTQDVFPMTHGQDFTCFPCRCSKNNGSVNQRIDSCTLAAVLRQKQVNLAAKKITAVDPKAFSSLGHVQRLSLANNSLIHLPPGLFKGLSSLEQLDLTRVELETLHKDSFLGLEQLKLLAMSDNQLTELSAATLRHLPLLEKLLLGGKNNEHGRTIVKGNRIKELGAIFGQNKELQVIDLTDNWLQKIDPATFAGLKKLRWLSLSSNQLTRIPAGTFHGLGHLRQLDLSDNEFTEIPAGTFHGLGQLQTLDLEWNKLTTIPPGTFQGLEHLRKLYLKRNKLTEIPAGTFQGLGQLQKLWLGSNQLTEIPAGTFHGLGQLRKLYLGSNKLTTFPPGTFQGLGQLRKLSLGSTKLTEIPAGTFQGLGQLQKLWLVSNKLTEIPAGAFQGLGQLRRLYLFSNKLTTIPAGTFQGLDQLLYLDLRENKFTEIPAGAFQGLGQLRDLYLSGNRLSTIAAEAFQGLDQLQLLWLNDNPWNSSSVCINSSLFPLLNDLRGLSFC